MTTVAIYSLASAQSEVDFWLNWLPERYREWVTVRHNYTFALTHDPVGYRQYETDAPASWLAREQGIHMCVRFNPTDPQNRRFTIPVYVEIDGNQARPSVRTWVLDPYQGAFTQTVRIDGPTMLAGDLSAFYVP